MEKENIGGVPSIKGKSGYQGFIGCTLKDTNRNGNPTLYVHDNKTYYKDENGNSRYKNKPIGKLDDANTISELKNHLKKMYQITDAEFELVKSRLNEMYNRAQHKFHERQEKEYAQIVEEIEAINPMLEIPEDFKEAKKMLKKLKKGVKGN